MKILLIGNFSEDNDILINGQTIKSDIIYKSMSEIEQVEVLKINTNLLKKKKILFFKILLLKLKKIDKIILMLGVNGMKYLFPIIYFLGKKYKKDIFYIVIGGWLAIFLEKNKFIKKIILNIKKILVETEGMKNELEKLKVNNVEVLYNFRKIDFIPKVTLENKNKFNLIFFSRVIKEKGIYDLIYVIKKMKNKNIFLDIWGPIKKEELKKLKNRIQNIKEIEYKGVLQKNIHEKLSEYDLMVFPTYYQGEGQAGVLIDAFISELPVLSSDWRFNSEFIINNETGFLYKAKDKNDLEDKLNNIIKNKDLLLKVKKNLKLEKIKYSDSNFKRKILKILEEDNG